MEIVLAIATILGGIAAVWYFWDKLRDRQPQTPAAPDAPAVPLQSAPPPAAAPAPVEKWVDFKYPSDSGLQARLEQEGYKVAWCLDNKLARKVDLEGWEIVVELDAQGILSRYRLKDRPDNQTFVRKRQRNDKA